MHEKRGNFCIFLWKIAEKDGKNRPVIKEVAAIEGVIVVVEVQNRHALSIQFMYFVTQNPINQGEFEAKMQKMSTPQASTPAIFGLISWIPCLKRRNQGQITHFSYSTLHKIQLKRSPRVQLNATESWLPMFAAVAFESCRQKLREIQVETLRQNV